MREERTGLDRGGARGMGVVLRPGGRRRLLATGVIGLALGPPWILEPNPTLPCVAVVISL